MKTANELLLAAIRQRSQKATEFAYGILTADRYVKTIQDQIGIHRCYRHMAKGSTSYDDLLKKASQTLVYSNPEMELEEVVDVKKLNGEMNKIQLPKNVLMTFRHVLTSSRKDRDGDVLHADGATVDPKMLLLWQHVHTMPIGKLLLVQEKNPNRLVCVSCIVDMNELCHDSAVMVDNGMGRFSHGFRALRFSKNKEGVDKDGEGFDVKEFEIMEESLVSVPANPDAETEEVLLSLVEGGKLTSPILKEIGQGIRSHRNIQVPGVKIQYREQVGGAVRELACHDFSQLKQAAEAGLIGVKNENKSADRTGERATGEGQAGTSKEADELASDKAKATEGETDKPQVTCPECDWKGPKPDDGVCPECGAELGGKTEEESVEEETEEKGEELDLKSLDAKPYANEHAARQYDPDKFDKFRRQNNKFGEGIHAIWGIDKEGKTTLQSIRFDSSKFSPEQAKKWLEEHKMAVNLEAAKEKEEATEEKSLSGTKIGRVISTTNEKRIRCAKENIDEVHGKAVSMERGHGALLREASTHLDEVLKTIGGETVEQPNRKPTVFTVSMAAALFLAEASPPERKRMMDSLKAITEVETMDRKLAILRKFGK